MLELVTQESATLLYVTHSRELAGLVDETWRTHSALVQRTRTSITPTLRSSGSHSSSSEKVGAKSLVPEAAHLLEKP